MPVKQTAFTLMIASVYVPFFYIQRYALSLNVSEDMSFNLLSLMNAASLIGRIGPNFLADRSVTVTFPQNHIPNNHILTVSHLDLEA